MKKMTMLICVLITSMSYTTAGFGFLDDIFKPPAGEKKKGEQRKSEGGGLIEGIGGILGADQKDIDLFKKGAETLQAMQPLGEAEEIAIGQAIAVEAFARFGGEYRGKALTVYVNLVGETVAEVSDRPELNYHFAILNSQEQNAFAAPGGYIFVTLGLLRTLKNEAELAGVLAHEIAHVTQRHMLDTIQRSTVLSKASELTLTAMNKDPKLYAEVIDEATDKLFEKGLDQDLEFEADQYGVEFAYRAGYNPRGLRDYLLTLNAQRGRGTSRFFSTHPPTGTRIVKVDDLLVKYQDGRSFPFLTKRFQKWMAKA